MLFESNPLLEGGHLRAYAPAADPCIGGGAVGLQAGRWSGVVVCSGRCVHTCASQGAVMPLAPVDWNSETILSTTTCWSLKQKNDYLTLCKRRL